MGRFSGGGPAPESRSQRVVEISDVAGGRKGGVTAKLFTILQACRKKP